MTSRPAPPLSAADLARLRALHRADQQAAAGLHRGEAEGRGLVRLARGLVTAFVVSGAYAVAAAAGVLPPAAWSALAG